MRHRSVRTTPSPALILAFSLVMLAASASAQVGWIAADARVRDDLQLLADSHLISAPLGSWPMPLAELDRILESLPQDARLAAGATQALRRLQALRTQLQGGSWQGSIAVAGGDPARLRGEADGLRETAQLQLSEQISAAHWGASLTLQHVSNARDGKDYRLDGSHLSGQLGNWVFSANTLDRLWGPSAQSSLILSDNARPIPALTLERARAAAPESRWLHWIGPWRLSAFVAQMEDARRDVRRPLLLGLRVASSPLPGLDLGISRTVEMCGVGRPCYTKIFWNALLGRDNVGEGGNVSAAEQPGNQLAGWDARLSSPWQGAPVAYYVQLIGEDAKNHRPTSRLAQHGVETWWTLDSGASLRFYFEYVDTVCAANSPRPLFNCAYTNGIFNQDGYRYRGRAIGHTADADSILRVAGMRLVDPDGRLWGLRYRTGVLNRDGAFDPNDTVSAGPSNYESIEASLRTAWHGSELEFQFGKERQTPQGSQSDSGFFGFASWRHSLN